MASSKGKMSTGTGYPNASSMEECAELMCQAASEYLKEQIINVSGNWDYREIVHYFIEKYGVFYPNLTYLSSSVQSYSSRPSVLKIFYTYRIGRVKLQYMEQEMDEEVARLSRLLFRAYMPAEVKIYLAHNYLATNIQYLKDQSNILKLSYSQSAYGALILKKCVCQGYAEAFKRLMDFTGVECRVIHGHTKIEHSEDDPGHAWNIVSPDHGRTFYHIDVTWDADVRPKYTYFCRNDAFFKGKRTWNNTVYPVCDGSSDILKAAREWVESHKEKLLERGVDKKVLDLGVPILDILKKR